MPRGKKKLVEQIAETPEEVVVDKPVEATVEVKPEVPVVETPVETKPDGVITMKAHDMQLGGFYTRTFTNRADADAWAKRFNAKEI